MLADVVKNASGIPPSPTLACALNPRQYSGSPIEPIFTQKSQRIGKAARDSCQLRCSWSSRTVGRAGSPLGLLGFFSPFFSGFGLRKPRSRPSAGHAKTRFKALDTSIKELADDIAYGVHDLEDGIALELITLQDWKVEHLDEKLRQLGMLAAGKKLFSDDHYIRKQAIGDLVYHIFKHLSMAESDLFNHPFDAIILRYRAKHAECLRA